LGNEAVKKYSDFKPTDNLSLDKVYNKEKIDEDLYSVLSKHWDNYIAWAKSSPENAEKTIIDYLDEMHINNLETLNTI
jgi:hypothetical protein